jgi:hypothetical protein
MNGNQLVDEMIETAMRNRRELVWNRTLHDSEFSNPDSLKEELGKLSSTFRDLTKTMEAQKMVYLGYFRNIEEALLRRNIEDGIINNIHNATPAQLDAITNKSKGFFVYYRDFYKEIEFFKISENDN